MEKNTPITQQSLHISEEVVATIVAQALRDVPGVAGLQNLPVRVPVLATPSSSRPVRVSINADVAELDVAVAVRLNYRLKDVCEQAQEAVKNAVQDMTGITVAKVNVFVTGVENE